MAKTELKLPELEELMSAPNLNEAQRNLIYVMEQYKKQNPKKFEVKKEEFTKKLIKLA